jgi:hypothetical protein
VARRIRRRRYAGKRSSLRSRRIRETSGQPILPPLQEALFRLKAEIEEFSLSLAEPALYQNGLKFGSLEELNFSLECLSSHLLLIFQINSKLVKRRILSVRREGAGRLEIHVEHFKARETFEIQSAGETRSLNYFKASRKRFQTYVEELVVKNFPKARIIRSTLHSDLEHSLSGKYVRLLFCSGRNQWAALAVSPWEDQATVDGILSNGFIWREHMKSQTAQPLGKLLMIVPAERSLVLKSRLRLIRGAGSHIHLVEMDTERDALLFSDLSDSGNVDTALTQVYALWARKDYAQTDHFKRIIDLAPRQIEPVVQAALNNVSFRIRGLEFAQLHLGRGDRLTFGVGKQRPVHTLLDWQELERLVSRILRQRQASGKDRRNLLFRLQSERWLESLILQDIRVIDSNLDTHFVYPQVPAFLGGDRGMIDILSLTKQGRLAVLELKVSEDIELPMQGLDYWLRVHWHQRRQEFSRKGYFPGTELSPEPPLLYFVCPQFCYHDSFPQIIQYIDLSVPMIQVGINENWRGGIRVVMRRELN